MNKPENNKSSAGAVWSLVLGILSLTCFNILTGIPAVIIGHKTKSRVDSDPEHYSGRGMALAGMVTGYISIAFFALFILMIVFAPDTKTDNKIVVGESPKIAPAQQAAAEQSTPAVQQPREIPPAKTEPASQAIAEKAAATEIKTDFSDQIKPRQTAETVSKRDDEKSKRSGNKENYDKSQRTDNKKKVAKVQPTGLIAKSLAPFEEQQAKWMQLSGGVKFLLATVGLITGLIGVALGWIIYPYTLSLLTMAIESPLTIIGGRITECLVLGMVFYYFPLLFLIEKFSK